MLRTIFMTMTALAAISFAAQSIAQQSKLTKEFVKTYDPFSDLPDGPPSPADPNDAAQVRVGNILYAEHCADCHGGALEGAENWRDFEVGGAHPPPPHDDTGHTWHHSDKQLFEYVKLGGEELFKDYPEIVSNMPGFGDVLSNEDIWAIFAFIKSTWSEENLKWQKGASKLDKLPEEYLPENRG